MAPITTSTFRRSSTASILPGLPDLPLDAFEGERLALGVEANVRWAMRQIRATPEVQESARHGVRLVGGVFEIATGYVRFLL